jgi:hypothetical protein
LGTTLVLSAACATLGPLLKLHSSCAAAITLAERSTRATLAGAPESEDGGADRFLLLEELPACFVSGFLATTGAPVVRDFGRSLMSSSFPRTTRATLAGAPESEGGGVDRFLLLEELSARFGSGFFATTGAPVVRDFGRSLVSSSFPRVWSVVFRRSGGAPAGAAFFAEAVLEAAATFPGTLLATVAFTLWGAGFFVVAFFPAAAAWGFVGERNRPLALRRGGFFFAIPAGTFFFAVFRDTFIFLAALVSLPPTFIAGIQKADTQFKSLGWESGKKNEFFFVFLRAPSCTLNLTIFGESVLWRRRHYLFEVAGSRGELLKVAVTPFFFLHLFFYLKRRQDEGLTRNSNDRTEGTDPRV